MKKNEKKLFIILESSLKIVSISKKDRNAYLYIG
jgi:hypothetical protein